MGKFVICAGIGLVSGVICFFLSVAFLCFFLLLYWAFSHTHPDMSLAYRVAAPVALFATLAGFIISLFRAFRRIPAEK
jgi:O-antigen/teichoic acid export membrane protein